jgi:starvation-inducible DNA-binding protein
MKPSIGISEKKIKSSATILTQLLANEMTLYVKTRKAHWNVSGESFMELHKLYENQYKQLEAYIDEIAERVGKLGHNAIGTLSEFLKFTTIKENPGKNFSTKETLKELLHDHEIIIVELREQVTIRTENSNDVVTNDFLIGIMEKHESIAWIVRRYLN